MTLREDVTTAERLRAVFDAPAPMTVGLEEEAMLLDPRTLDLAPVAAEVLARIRVDAPVKLELPASQLEVVTEPSPRLREALEQLAAGRATLAAAARGLALPAAAGAHPFAAPLGELNAGERYDAILAEYGAAGRSQLVCGLQIHVAVGGADRTLAVYNALRGHLPEIAALAANAPFYAGRDSGLASVRPLIAGLLPRQGVPPAIASWDAFAETFDWGRRSGAVPEPRCWWWELRPHPRYGTLELRVPDAQSTVRDAAGVAAFAHTLVAWLTARHDAGQPLASHDSWRIGENRWTALRHGLDGEFADLATGAREPVRDVLRARLDQLRPFAAELDCEPELAAAEDLVEANGATRLRTMDPVGAARALADAYLADN